MKLSNKSAINNKSIEYIYTRLFKLERDHNLLDCKISGIKIWQACRTFIYYQIAREAGAFSEMHTVKNSLWDRFSSLPSYIRSCLFYNPFLDHEKNEILVFDHSRKMFIRGEYIDIYTKYLIDRLILEGESFRVYEEPDQNRHKTWISRERLHLDIILILANIFAITVPLILSKNEKLFIRKLRKEIKEEFGIQINLKNYLVKEIKKFRALYFLYDHLFKMKRPKKIFVLVGYGHAALIYAAKQNGIEVIELQHGNISEFHPGYHFPDSAPASLDYFPHKLYVWDDFWKEMCTFPIEKKDIITFRFEHLQREKRQYRDIRKKNNQIAIISQGAVGPKLADFVLQNISDLQDYIIIYKLHPGEYQRWKSYSSLVELSQFENIKIVDNNYMSLYRILAESRFVVGIYSTAVFEALDFNCKIILADLPGVEYMRRFVELNKAKVCESNERLVDYLTGKW